MTDAAFCADGGFASILMDVAECMSGNSIRQIDVWEVRRSGSTTSPQF